MRLFAALPLAGPARASLARTIAALQAERWPVRWVDAALIHLTLKFYGEVPAERAVVIGDALAAALRGAPPVLVEAVRLGTLPGGRAARVVVAEVEPAPALELLQHRIERAGEVVGVPVEGRPFRPHLTLGRLRAGERLPGGARPRLAREVIAITELVDRVELYESRPGGGGPRYLPVRRYGLAA